MKELTVLLVVVLFFSCQHPAYKEKPSVKDQDIAKLMAKFKEKDSIAIVNDTSHVHIIPFNDNEKTLLINDLDTLELPKRLVVVIENIFPELASINSIIHPDSVFALSRSENNSKQKRELFKEYFGSMAGGDNFYYLYTFYLIKRNGVEKYNKERKALNLALNSINEIMANPRFGGTYYGHIQNRLPAYTEYAIHQIHQNPKLLYNLNKKNKSHLLSCIKKIYTDDKDAEYHLYSVSRKQIQKEYDQQLQILNKSLTNNLSLRVAYNFLVSYYYIDIKIEPWPNSFE